MQCFQVDAAFRAEHERLVDERDRGVTQHVAHEFRGVRRDRRGKIDERVSGRAQHGFCLLDGRGVATDEKRELALFRSGNAARHPGRHESQLFRAQRRHEPRRVRRVAGRAVDHRRPRRGGMGGAVLPQQHRFDFTRGRQAQNHEFAAARGLARRGRHRGAGALQAFRHAGAAAPEYGDRVAVLEQVCGHGLAHGADTDECDFRHPNFSRKMAARAAE